MCKKYRRACLEGSWWFEGEESGGVISPQLPLSPPQGRVCLLGWKVCKGMWQLLFVFSSDQLLASLTKDDFSVTSSPWVEKMLRFS